MQRQCVNCGAALGPSDTFCGECGTPAVPVAYPAPVNPPAQPVYYAPQPVLQKRKSNTALVGIAIVVLLAALGGGGFLLLNGGISGGHPTTPTPTTIAVDATPTTVASDPTPTTIANISPTNAPVAARPFTRGKIRKLTNNTDHNVFYSYPAWNSHGTSLAFAIHNSGSPERHIYTVPASGGDPQQLTTDSGVNDYKPVWFGDNQIGFTRWITNSNGIGLYRAYYMNSNGGQPIRMISDTLDTNQYAIVDSNSSTLVVADDSNSSSSNLHVYQVGTHGGLRDIRQLDTGYWFAASSSSDRYFVFPKAESDKSTNLYLMNSATGTETQLTNTPADEGQPSWRSGDRLITFTYYDQQSRCYVIALDEQGKPGQPFRLLSDNLGTYDADPV